LEKSEKEEMKRKAKKGNAKRAKILNTVNSGGVVANNLVQRVLELHDQ